MGKDSQITANCHKGHPLKTYDFNIKEGLQIMRCDQCGLFYHYTHGYGGWKLQRVSEMAYMSKKALKL